MSQSATPTATQAPPRRPDHRNAGTRRRTPRMSGSAIARQTLRGGLAPDSLLMRGRSDSDIVRASIGLRTGFVLHHPDYVDHVLHAGTAKYHKSIEYEMLRAVLGLSLFTDEDESWRRHRMMLNPVFGKRHVRAMYGLMSDPVRRFARRLDNAADAAEIEMTYAMTELTLEVVGSALFGRGLGDFARRMAPNVTEGLRAAERAARVLLVTAPPPWVPRGLVWTINRLPYAPWPLGRVQQVMRTMDESVWEVIRDRQRNPRPEADDLLGLLLEARDEGGEPLPLKRVRDEALTIMLAGHETTANALSWFWYLMALNGPQRERMLAEVDEVCGGLRADEPVGFEQVAELRLTTACLMEAMRVFPPAWVIPRAVVEDDEIDGCRIPAGSSVVIPINSIHHDERFWPDPESFEPERFLPGAPKHHRSAYLPFGGGRRICIGQSFALTEMAMIAAEMSRGHVYDLVPGHPVEPEATLTLRPRNGLRMIARRRRPGG